MKAFLRLHATIVLLLAALFLAAKRPPTRRVNSGKGHRYIVDGASYAGRGVTTLLGDGLPKPFLVGWSANVTAAAAIHERDVWEPLLEKAGEQAAEDYLRNRRWQTSTDAAVRGTDVHKLAERIGAGETVEVDDVTAPFVDAYLAFRRDFRPVDELAERMIVNRKHVYAGTFDLVARLEGWPAGTPERPDPTDPAPVVMVDYKTSKRVYPENGLQLAAYRNGETMLPIDGESPEEPMPETVAGAVLLLSADATYELRPVESGERAFRTFLYAAQIAGFAKRDEGWGEQAVGRPLVPMTTERISDE